MTDLVNPKDAIAAFQIVRDKGELADGKYHYGGLQGSTDIDGYTVFLGDSRVDMAVYYHYKYSLDYKSQEDVSNFNRKIKALLAER